MPSNRPTAGRWSARTVVLAVIVLFHAGLFYFLATQRSRTGSGDDRQAFTPIERKTGSSTGSLADNLPRRDATAATAAVTLWRFQPFDLWPAQAGAQWPNNSPAFAAAQALPREPGSAQSESAQHRVAISIGAWPEYRAAWAREGDDGSVLLELGIDEHGKATDISVRNSSATSRLEDAAKRAVSLWVFSRPASMSPSARVELEMRFNAYRYQLSRVTGLLPDGEAKTNLAVVSSEEALRRLISELSSSKPTFATLENTQADFQKMRATVVKWGRAREVRLLNPEESDWKEYIAKPDFRSNSHGGTIALRWDLYDVRHENTRSQWKIAVDPYGRIWAAKADTRSTEP